MALKYLICWMAAFLTLASCAITPPSDQRLAKAETRIKVLETEIKRTEEAHRKAEQELNMSQRNLERQRANELRLRQDFEKKDRGLTLDEQLTFLKESAWSETTWGVRRGTSKNLEKLPPQMNIDDSFTFRLVVQPERNSVTLTDIKNKFKVEYKVDDNQLEKIATTGVMAAELHGDGFTITPRKHPTESQDNDGFVVKPIALYKETVWDWTVKAAELSRKEEGHALFLSLFVYPEDAKGKFIKVIGRDWQIVVYETVGQKLAGFTGDHWQWIWSAFIIPVVGWIFQIRKSRMGYASA